MIDWKRQMSAAAGQRRRIHDANDSVDLALHQRDHREGVNAGAAVNKQTRAKATNSARFECNW